MVTCAAVHAGSLGLQVTQRRVKVGVPGKFFPSLQPAEQRESYEGEAVEGWLQSSGREPKAPNYAFLVL